MPFAIEALQCKSKQINARREQLSQTLWPELRQKEESTIAQAATRNIKNVARALLARVRIGRAGNAARESEQQDAEIVATDEANDDGFLEVNIVKRIQTGNKLMIPTPDRE